MILSPALAVRSGVTTSLTYYFRSVDQTINAADADETVKQFAAACLKTDPPRAITEIVKNKTYLKVKYAYYYNATAQQSATTQALALQLKASQIWTVYVKPAGQAVVEIGKSAASVGEGFGNALITALKNFDKVIYIALAIAGVFLLFEGHTTAETVRGRFKGKKNG